MRKGDEWMWLALIALFALGGRPSAASKPDYGGERIRDVNGIEWTIYPDQQSKADYWLAEVVDPYSPYSPSLSRLGRKAVIDALNEYARAHPL